METRGRGGVEEGRRGKTGVSDESEDDICDYEKKRLQNIRKNHSMLRSLGLPCKLPVPQKNPPSKKRGGKRGRGRKMKKRHTYTDSSSASSASDSSEDEWQPWKEEAKRRPRGGRVSEKIAPLDFQSKQQIFTAASSEIKNKMRTLNKEGQRKKVPQGKLSTSVNQSSTGGSGAKSKRRQPVKKKEETELDMLFQSSDDDEDEEFLGFTQQDVDETAAEVCSAVPTAVCEEWVALFGEEKGDKEFTGFTRDEVLTTAVPQSACGSTGRRKVRVHYQEEVISDDDEYLFCDDCNALHQGECPVHGALSTLPDIGSDQNSLQYTKLPVPGQLTVKPSSIAGAGLGVFATENIARGVRFGPYVGKKVPASHVDDDTDTSYMWEIKQDGVKSYFIDGSDEYASNWLRFINCAHNEEEQNMVAFQYHGYIYYRTFKTVYPGNEVLVWYGEEYAVDLGITVEYSGDQANHMCKGCGLCFVEERSFQIHLKHNRQCEDTNPRVFKCGKCQQRFSKLRQLQTHILRHEEFDQKNSRTYFSSEIEEQENISLFDNHSRLNEIGFNREVRTCRCQYCDKTLSSSSGLQLHLRTHTGEKPYKCEYCGKAFSQAGVLRRHLRTHTGDKPYKCEYCGKAFSRAGNLRTHLRTHTGDKPYKCEYCGKAFSLAGHLRKHLRTHTGDKPYKCEYCGKAFSQAGNLRKHLRTHTGDKPYKCEYCGKAFSQAEHLRTHLRTHTGDKPYKCEHCGKAFSDNCNLRTHLHTHTGEKPYKCEYCGKAFSRAGVLRTHLRTHTGDKPYKCEYCGKAFSHSSTLKSHRSTNHGPLPDTVHHN